MSESIQWLGGNRSAVTEFVGDSLIRFDGDHQQVSVVISNGEVTANLGDFISRDRDGLFHVAPYVCTDNIFELHPAGTVIRLTTNTDSEGELFTVCEDGLWRNEVGMIPAGQMAEPSSTLGKHCHECRCADRYLPPQHCRGCRCKGEQDPPAGRQPHGGFLP